MIQLRPVEDKDTVQISRLRSDSVMCEMAKCNRPAQFLLRYPSGALRAACEEHTEAMRRWNRMDSGETG
jgi:hypothetical protein